jgi:DNA-3-methyladenine glycosylase I
MNPSAKPRCHWAKSAPLLMTYHDEEWGVPIYDDTLLFEFLILEGAQAGLNWLTILKRRASYRAAFDNFNAQKIACFAPEKVAELLNDPGIIRNRLKVQATIINAQAFLQVQKEFGNFTEYIWTFVEGLPIKNHWATLAQVPTSSEISDRLSKNLRQRGFKFVGSTICYAFMQAVGMVDDHTQDCFCYAK